MTVSPLLVASKAYAGQADALGEAVVDVDRHLVA
jgi:hypothetical protein